MSLYFYYEYYSCTEVLFPMLTDHGATELMFSWSTFIQVFILHLQLKDIIFKGELFENPLIESMMDAASDSGKSPSLDISSAFFGSEVFLGWGLFNYIFFEYQKHF